MKTVRRVRSAMVLGCMAVLFLLLIGCTSRRAVGEPPVETVTPAPVVDPARSLLTGPPPGYVKPEIYWVREKIILGSEPAPPASSTQKSVVKKGKKHKKTGKRLTEREATSIREAMHVERSVETEGLRGIDHRFCDTHQRTERFTTSWSLTHAKSMSCSCVPWTARGTRLGNHQLSEHLQPSRL
jgi:hypothetical protein